MKTSSLVTHELVMTIVPGQQPPTRVLRGLRCALVPLRRLQLFGTPLTIDSGGSHRLAPNRLGQLVLLARILCARRPGLSLGRRVGQSVKPIISPRHASDPPDASQ